MATITGTTYKPGKKNATWVVPKTVWRHRQSNVITTFGLCSMLNRFDGLLHHTIICSDYQYNNVSYMSTSGSHSRKGSMPWCVQKSDTLSGWKWDCSNKDCIKPEGFQVSDTNHCLPPAKAPICWVMPPNSSLTTDVWRKESKRVVFPWSTWPITVTTGGLFTRDCGSGGGLKRERWPRWSQWSWAVVKEECTDFFFNSWSNLLTTSLMMASSCSNGLLPTTHLRPDRFTTSTKTWTLSMAVRKFHFSFANHENPITNGLLTNRNVDYHSRKNCRRRAWLQIHDLQVLKVSGSRYRIR